MPDAPNVVERIKTAIDKSFEDDREEELRNHLGFSIIGRKCAREVYYSWRWASDVKFAGRILRIFGRGHDTEPKMQSWLEKAGFGIDHIDPATGEQYLASYYGGFVGGSCDGLIHTVPDWFTHQTKGLFECKSHNTKSFCNLVNKGVLSAKPEHYIQMQCYMHAFGCEWGLYCALNKNDEDVYFEIVSYQGSVAEAMLEKAKDIVLRTTIPKKISNDPNWFECSFCDHKEVCHLKGMVRKSCRSCEHVRPQIGPDGKGQFYCTKFGAVPPDEWLKKGCDEWSNGLL